MERGFRVWGLLAILAVLLPVARSQDTNLVVGYATIRAQEGSTTPVASALFTLRSGGVLISEAAVAAVAPIRAGRIFVDRENNQTGVAWVNPSSTPVTLKLTLRDSRGQTIATVADYRLDAGRHAAVFLEQLFDNFPESLTTGTLSFETQGEGEGVAAVTIRLGSNARNEPLFATLPVVGLEEPPGAGPIVFPQVGAGGSLSTQIILINRHAETIRGEVRLFGGDGAPLELESDGAAASTIPYEIAPEGTFRSLLTSSRGVFQGYAQVVPESGPVPAGTAVFQFRDGQGRLVSEAGVASTPPTRRARILVDTVGTQTGLAVANPGNGSQSIALTLRDRYGRQVASVARQIPAGGHFAGFADDFLDDVPEGFTGVLDIDSESPVVPVTLKLSVNQRGDLILTTLPLADRDRPPSSNRLIVPQFGSGPDLSTRLILINPRDEAAAGTVSLADQEGRPLALPFAGETVASRTFAISAAGGGQLRPGNSARPAQVLIGESPEINVNGGAAVVLRPRVIDSRGEVRDDFTLDFASLDETVARVDSLGRLEGLEPGFSTLAVTSDGVLATATVTVTGVTSGSAGFEISGVVRDLSGRLFLASGAEHAVFLSDASLDAPEVYAGIEGRMGFENGERLRALFSEPSFLAINQAQGRLYVSDTQNHAIRSVDSGAAGRVGTLAGGGGPGFLDGPAAQASFRSPMGLALDDRGGLWVADTGNHTIRRVSLSTGQVETVAGSPGQAGLTDGTGQAARFDTPVGIAFEVESLARQLERLAGGGPPPPASVIVADAGNRALRRVWADGRVETLARLSTPSGLRLGELGPAADAPESVAVDSSGTIFATFPESGRVAAFLPNGQTAEAAQPGTFLAPRAALAGGGGRLFVADSGGSLFEVRYGAPVIESVSPAQAASEGDVEVTVRGRNFSPETAVVLAGVVISEVEIADTGALSFRTPRLPSGRLTLTLQNRGGLAQTAFLVEPPPLSSLEAGEITTVAGGSTFAGDGGPALQAPLSFPQGVALDAAGNLFVSDTFNHRIRRVLESTGTINTVAGNGMAGFSGDGGLAAAAALNTPADVAFDPAGNLYFSESINARIRRVDAATGVVSTAAGNGRFGYSGDGGPATQASISLPKGITFDGTGNLFVADTGNGRIRRVDAVTGVISTVAGDGLFQPPVDGVPATESSLFLPDGVAVDRAGNLFVSDTQNHRIRRVDAGSGLISTVAGTGLPGFGGDGGPAVDAVLNTPAGIAIGLDGEVLFADRLNQRIRRIVSGRIETVAGDGSLEASGDGGPALEAGLANPSAITRDGAGNLLLADSGSLRVRRVDALTGVIDTVAGSGMANIPGDGGPAFAAGIASPFRVLFDSRGGLLVVETGVNRIRRVDPANGTISTVAGVGLFGLSGDGGPASEAALAVPEAIAEDVSGNLYVSERQGHRIRRIDAVTGRIETIAGGMQGFSPDGTAAVEARLDSPSGIVFDGDGNLYFSDTQNHRVRRIVAVTGALETVAGNGSDGFSGDGGMAVDAALSLPSDLVFDRLGNLFVVDFGNNRVRRIDAGTGRIETVAGGGSLDPATGPEPISAVDAAFVPTGVVVDGDGTLYVSDFIRHRVWAIDASTGRLRLVAGNGVQGVQGDGGPGPDAELSFPRGLTLGPEGDLYIADTFNGRIRVVARPSGR